MLTKNWEFDVLGIYNYEKNDGPLRFYFDFVKENVHLIEGDLLEAGVFKGNSIVSMGLMLKKLGSNKKVYGFDSFAGFPPVFHYNDNFERFGELFEQNKISKEHFSDIVKNKNWRSYLTGLNINSSSISSSGDFSATSKGLVEKKLEILDLDNVVLIDGTFEETMIDGNGPKKLMCALMDCDLYQSYLTTFNYSWPKLSHGGMIYLDEYYSLKFPGAKIATDLFVQNNPDTVLGSFDQIPGDFERWFLSKK